MKGGAAYDLGILRETKKGENRVICTPKEVETITSAGHTVYAQRGCGERAGFSDEAYESAGALLTDSVQELFKVCDMVAKVKEFTPEEWPLIRTGQLLLGCLHPAANPEEVDALMKSGCIAFTAEDSHRYGSPNCEAAGKQGALFGLESLLTIHGGKGKYVGGFAGEPGIHALILGSGKVGRGALQVLQALGANCTVMARNMHRLRALSAQYNGRVRVRQLLTGAYCGRIAENGYRPQLCQMAEGEQRVPHHPKHAFPHGKGLSDRGYFQRRAGRDRDQPRDHA